MRRRFLSLVMLAVLILTVGLASTPSPATAAPAADLDDSCATDMGTRLVVVLVHGFNSKGAAWEKAEEYLAGLGDGNLVHPVVFDYEDDNTDWVTSPPIAPRLAETLTCLAANSGRSGGSAQVVAVGHSMGGLAIRCALQPDCSGVDGVDQAVAQVITVGTPTAGSYLREGGFVNDLLRQAVNAAACRGGDILPVQVGFPEPCDYVRAFASSDAAAAFYNQSSELYALRTGQTDVPVLAIAGTFQLKVSVLFRAIEIGDGGDFVVGTNSQHAWATETETVDCGALGFHVLTLSFGYTGSSIGALPCWHMSEVTNDDVLQRIGLKVTEVAEAARSDVTLAALAYAEVPSVCDHPAGRLDGGVLTAPGEDAGTTQLGDVTFGNLDDDDAQEAVVTLMCDLGGTAVMFSAHVYDAGAKHLGVLNVAAGREVSRAWDVALTGVRIDDGAVTVTGLDGDDDDPICCPSVHLGARFKVVDGEVVQLSVTAPSEADAFHVDGWGSLHIGDSYEAAATATGWPLDVDYVDENDPSCTYVGSIDAPSGLWVIGSDETIASIVMTEPGVQTPSGVTIGTTETEVLDAYVDAQVEREPNAYVPVDDVIVAAGDDGRVIRLEFDDDRRVAAMHNGDRNAALLAEGCL